jgi:hypothetical protein
MSSTQLLEARHVSVSINREPHEVYDFAVQPENLARWAAGLGHTIRHVDGEWIAHGPLGEVNVRFVERNDLGVLDHDVVFESGATVHNPIRVVPNGSGSEVTFTLFRQPDVSAEEFAEDAAAVEGDLRTLKTILEETQAS